LDRAGFYGYIISINQYTGVGGERESSVLDRFGVIGVRQNILDKREGKPVFV
jgi:hypothetical protein